MKKINITTKFFLLLLLATFSVTIFIYLFKVIENKNIHTQAAYVVLAEKVNFKNQSDAIKRSVSLTKEAQKKINSYFVDVENIDLFMGELESLGPKSGVDVMIKSVEPSKTDEKYITINFSTEGSFANIFKVIQMVEYMPYKIHLKNVYLNKNIIFNQDPKANKTSVTGWQADISFQVLNS